MATMYYRPYSSEPTNNIEQPDDSAVEAIINKYGYILPETVNTMQPQPHYSPSPKQQLTRMPALPEISDPEEIKPHEQKVIKFPVVIDPNPDDLMKHRLAIGRMEKIIFSLQERLRISENENAALKREFAAYNESAKYLLETTEFDGLTKADIISRYIVLKKKLIDTVAELSNCKERMQKLSTELLKNTNSTTKPHQRQYAQKNQISLDKYQDKCKQLKEYKGLCEQQEQIIDKMERLLSQAKNVNQNQNIVEKVLTSAKEPMSSEKNISNIELLSKRNEALEQERDSLLNTIHNLQNQKEEQSAVKISTSNNDAECAELYQLLDIAQQKIAALETQLSENARKWGAEKEKMLQRLKEYEFGLQSTLEGVRSSMKIRNNPNQHGLRHATNDLSRKNYNNSYNY